MTSTATDRVADAPADIWVYRILPRALWPYAQLARWDRPIGWWLLLWPCWWSLALAWDEAFSHIGVEVFNIHYVDVLLGYMLPPAFLFWLGAVMMRGAGCTYNDFVDVDFDAQVARTASRPIPSGRISRKQSIVFMAVQAFVGLICLLGLSGYNQVQMNEFEQSQMNEFAILLGIASLAVVVCYPFAKRITNWPQLVLGLAFSWGALMGWAVIFGEISEASLLLYAGSVLWVIGYDTIYAHQDREDDALVGVHSTARLFGDKTKAALIVLYAGTLALFAAAFSFTSASWPAYMGLAIGGAHMIWQIRSLNIDDADKCLALFKSNTTFGWIVFGGLLFDIVV